MRTREDSPERRAMASELAYASMMMDAGVQEPFWQVGEDLRRVSRGSLSLRYKLDLKNKAWPHLFIVMDLRRREVWDHFRFSDSDSFGSAGVLNGAN